jgi:hypothetical protein
MNRAIGFPLSRFFNPIFHSYPSRKPIMVLRFKSTVLAALLLALHGIFPDAFAESQEQANPSGFFSVQKALDTYSAYRPYMESDSDASGPAASDEVRKKVELGARLLKSPLVSEEMLTRIARMEGRFAKEIAGTVPDEKVEEVFSRGNMRDLGLNEAEVSLLKGMIKSQLYFDAPVNIRKAKEVQDLAVIEKQTEIQANSKPLTVEALRIQGGSGDACLASAPEGEGGGCLVSVAEFNAYLPYADAQTDVTVAEARDNLVRFYAFQKLKSLKGREDAKGMSEEEAQSIVQRVRGVQEYRKMRESLVAMGMGMPVTDKESLMAAYHKYYRRYFADRDSVLLQVLAMSDSAYADSIHGKLVAAAAKVAAANGKTLDSVSASAPDPALPWVTFNETALPRELVAPTDTFSVGDFTRPIKTQAGFFLVKLFKVYSFPRIPFENAQAKCIYLATRDKYAGLDSLLTAKARKHYQEHPDEFHTPDTTAYRFWRVPGKKCGRVGEYAKDTAHVQSMIASGTDLPRTVTGKVQTGKNQTGKNQTDKNRSAIIPDSLRLQLVETKYGQMLVELLSVKKGGRKIAFPQARKGIVDEWIRIRDAQDPIVQLPASDSAVSKEVFFTLGTGNLMYESVIEEAKDISDSDIDAAVQQGQLDVSDIDPKAPKSQYYTAAKQKMEYGRIEKKQGELQARLNDIRFNTGLLTSN